MKVYYQSPIGLIELEGDEKGIKSCSFVKKTKTVDKSQKGSSLVEASESLKEAWKQLDEYFKGQRKYFSVKLNLNGTEFQRKVWKELQKIPFGQTRSYREIAEACGCPRASRAVGGANHRNPAVIFVPCHRVIGADGNLTGFGAGLWRKKWLLEHERKYAEAKPFETNE